MPSIICPICRLAVEQQAKTWICAKGHSFDVAREGYVNLLPVQHKHSREPGDAADMLKARREFLNAGYYQGLREAVLNLLAPLQAHSLLDVGCGEGYYTGAFTTIATDITGLDIAKPAIQLAARRFQGITWLVGSGAVLPIADASVDIVCSLFSQLHIDEMVRVLRPGGHVLVVTPASDHLHAVRAALFEEVRLHEPGKFIAGFEERFELRSREEVRFPLNLTQHSLQQLLLMTPYVWKAKPEKREALEASESFDTNAAFTLLLFRKGGTL
jgi:23S rRNA (guanine745-N1)-methyltransferase